MAQDNEIFIEDDSVALEDIEDTESTSEDSSVSSIIPYVMDRYKRSEDFRNQDEQRWLRSYRNYRGQYGSDVQFTEAEKSRVFIKVTKTKVIAAFGQLVDVIFGTGQFPIGVKETKIPEGAHLVENDKASLPNPKLGHVSSSCWSVEYNNPFSIGVLKDGKNKIGQQLFAVYPLKDISIPVEVVSSHYVDPKGERVRV